MITHLGGICWLYGLPENSTFLLAIAILSEYNSIHIIFIVSVLLLPFVLLFDLCFKKFNCENLEHVTYINSHIVTINCACVINNCDTAYECLYVHDKKKNVKRDWHYELANKKC